MYKEERNVLEEEMREIDERDIEEFDIHLVAARKHSLFWEIDGGHRRRNRKGIRSAKQNLCDAQHF